MSQYTFKVIVCAPYDQAKVLMMLVKGFHNQPKKPASINQLIGKGPSGIEIIFKIDAESEFSASEELTRITTETIVPVLDDPATRGADIESMQLISG